ncbi:MAG TPA: DUF4292 domain-containing protein [Chitinophagaceae bacterium]|nr:DUF4292 domain-containing protein [Chitinophagaceae bacterium]
MIRVVFFLAIVTGILATSCRSTRKIQTAISKKDSTAVIIPAIDSSVKADTAAIISQALQKIRRSVIDYTTFSAKINVDYQGADGKKYDVNANLRMYRDSAIWISITAIFGIEGLRAYITKDSVKLLNKQDKIYTARSVGYLQDITALPLDLYSLQEILIGNPVFLNEEEVVGYSRNGNSLSLLSLGQWFKNLLTINESGKIESSKMDDADRNRSRTCQLTYAGYENKKEVNFSTRRRITVSEKGNLDIKLDFKSYEFNETLSFPFSVPKNYKTE